MGGSRWGDPGSEPPARTAVESDIAFGLRCRNDELRRVDEFRFAPAAVTPAASRTSLLRLRRPDELEFWDRPAGGALPLRKRDVPRRGSEAAADVRRLLATEGDCAGVLRPRGGLLLALLPDRPARGLPSCPPLSLRCDATLLSRARFLDLGPAGVVDRREAGDGRREGGDAPRFRLPFVGDGTEELLRVLPLFPFLPPFAVLGERGGAARIVVRRFSNSAACAANSWAVTFPSLPQLRMIACACLRSTTGSAQASFTPR